MASPATVSRPVLRPRARAIVGVSPPARMAVPSCVRKKRYSPVTAAATMASTTVSRAASPASAESRPRAVNAGPATASARSNSVVVFMSGTLLRPSTTRFTLASAVLTRIPASSGSTPRKACTRAVTTPAVAPAAMPPSVASSGSTPAVRSTAATTAPSVNEPSVVMSGNENSL